MLTIKETIQRAAENGLQEKMQSTFYAHEYLQLLEMSENEIQLIDNALTAAYYRGYVAGSRSKRKRNK